MNVRQRLRSRPLLVCRLTSLLGLALLAGSTRAAPPATIYWQGAHLERVREAPAERDRGVRKSLRQLERAANEALERGPYSVTDKGLLPPSGDKHDYMSFSRYWWPNPDTEDGLPYVRRDGVVNRELVSRGDRVRLGSFCDDVEVLSLAAYLLDRQRCAKHAELLIRTWFLDPATRMSPNLNYGQAVPGVAEGRGPGVLDTRHFIRVIDSFALLESMGQVDSEVGDGLREWFREYYAWLQSSDLGRHEREAKNNHGVWYDAQTASIALFIGDRDEAQRVLLNTRDRRLPAAVRPDGSQPEELRRTLSLHYSLFSLSAYAVCARVAESVDVDLWRPAEPEDAGFETALQYAAPFVINQDGWPHQQLSAYSISDSQAHLFYLASSALDDARYLEYLDAAPRRESDLRLAPLLFAKGRE